MLETGLVVVPPRGAQLTRAGAASSSTVTAPPLRPRDRSGLGGAGWVTIGCGSSPGGVADDDAARRAAYLASLDIEGSILFLCGLRDTDLAELHGVETRALLREVRRNPERFPEAFAFPLTTAGWTHLNHKV